MRFAPALLALVLLVTACDRSSTTTPTEGRPTTTGRQSVIMVKVVEWPAAAKRFLRQTIEGQGGRAQSITCGRPTTETRCTVSWTDARGYACDVSWPLKINFEGVVRTAEEFPVICTLNG